jgi:hypothetical protein
MRADMRTHLKNRVQVVHDASTIQVKQPHQEQHTGLQRGSFTAIIPGLSNETESLTKSATFCCRCRPIAWESIIRIRDSKMQLRHCKFMREDCPVHQHSSYSSQTAVRYRKGMKLLRSMVELEFLIGWTSVFPSLGVSLRTEARVKILPLYGFFRGLYKNHLRQRKIYPATSTRGQCYSMVLVSKEKQDYLFSVARKTILKAYQSGNASPQDVDKKGRTLLHARIHLISISNRVKLNCLVTD